MFDDWKVQDFAPGAGKRAGAHEEAYDEQGWLDAKAPGDLFQALIDGGRLDDPFYDRNESDCTWIEEREWWYRTRVMGPAGPLAPAERVQLVFHGSGHLCHHLAERRGAGKTPQHVSTRRI